MLNKLLLKTLLANNAPQVSAMTSDRLESPSTYKGWIYPVRYLLSLRYLKHKQKALVDFRKKRIYPVADEEFKEALIQQLMGSNKSNKASYSKPQTAPLRSPFLNLFSIAFKSFFIVPLLIATLFFGSYSLNQWYQQRKIENVLSNYLPYYSDLLHRKLLLKHNDGNAKQLKTIDNALQKTQQKILADLPEKDGIRDSIAEQLERLSDRHVSGGDIMLGFKSVNTLFDQKGLPYYLTPKSFSMPCSSLIDAPVEQMMMLKKMEELMSNGKPELCRTTMMTVYKVAKRNALFYQHANKNGEPLKTELPLFQVSRVDKVPAVDSALGLTFKDKGLGSILLMDRIKNFSDESILPALTFQGRNYIIPYWMQGYYEIEEAISKGYKKDLDMIYAKKSDRIKVKKAIKKLIKNKKRLQNAKMKQTLEQNSSINEENIFGGGLDAISVLLNRANKEKKTPLKVKNKISDDEYLLLDKLNTVLLPSIELHEAYHQIDKKNWEVPSWLAKTFKDELTESGTEHTMEELGAYLSQLANTEQAHNIWLSKLLIFSLNPMTKGQAEYYASSLILDTMESLRLGASITPSYTLSIDKKTAIYKSLTTLNTLQIRELAKRAFEVLFEREVPDLRYPI
jgi:hypothetical protein